MNVTEVPSGYVYSSPVSHSGRRRTQPGYAAILTGPYRGSYAFWEVKRLIRKDKKRHAAMAIKAGLKDEIPV